MSLMPETVRAHCSDVAEGGTHVGSHAEGRTHAGWLRAVTQMNSEGKGGMCGVGSAWFYLGRAAPDPLADHRANAESLACHLSAFDVTLRCIV